MSDTGDDGRERRRAGILGTYDANVAAQRDREPGALPDLYIHFGYWDVQPDLASMSRDFRVAQETYNDHVLSAAQLSDGQGVLDAGCGFGGTLSAIDRRWTHMTLVGLNIDPRQLAVASSQLEPRPTNSMTWVEGDASELAAFGAGTFDRVLAVESILHFASRRAFLRHAARVLRAGGRLALSDLVATRELRHAHEERRLPPDVDRIVERSLAPWPDFWGDDSDYEELATAAGLSLDTYVDATTQTRPSYRAILRDDDASADAGQREGMLLLEWLQERGLLKLVYAGFAKR